MTYRHKKRVNIRKTYPCNEYPLRPHFHIGKLGFAGVCIVFLLLNQNIDCGCPEQNIKNIKFFSNEIFIFTSEKIICILYGQVFVMSRFHNSKNIDGNKFNKYEIEKKTEHFPRNRGAL